MDANEMARRAAAEGEKIGPATRAWIDRDTPQEALLRTANEGYESERPRAANAAKVEFDPFEDLEVAIGVGEEDARWYHLERFLRYQRNLIAELLARTEKLTEITSIQQEILQVTDQRIVNASEMAAGAAHDIDDFETRMQPWSVTVDQRLRELENNQLMPTIVNEQPVTEEAVRRSELAERIAAHTPPRTISLEIVTEIGEALADALTDRNNGVPNRGWEKVTDAFTTLGRALRG